MNKFKKLLAVAGSTLALLPLTTLAVVDPNTIEVPGASHLDVAAVFALATKITNWFFGGIIVLAVIFILISAFNFLTAGGNEDKLKTAKNTLMYALVGVGVAILAKTLVYFVCVIVQTGGTANCSFI